MSEMRQMGGGRESATRQNDRYKPSDEADVLNTLCCRVALFKRLHLPQRVTAAKTAAHSRCVCSFPTQAVPKNQSGTKKKKRSVVLFVHLENLRAYLVNLVPAVLVLAADGGVVVEQELTAARVSSHHHAVIQRSQTSAVLVVWRSSQLQQRLTEEVGWRPETDRERSDED